ncbi:MAG: hypothetical protein L3J73_04520 [Thermoplasmata archaeon]|nr:hypothetical protein [Thermoplasmata archaeon]
MGRSRHAVRVPATVLLVLALVATCAPGAGAAYPTLPLALEGRFLTDLSASVLQPGESGSISFVVADPLPADMTNTVLRLEVYAFNAYPGNATQTAPPDAVEFVSDGLLGNTPAVSLLLQTVVPGAPVPESVPIASSASAPSGTYAVRFTLDFDANGTSYHLASRGEFSDALWAAATTGPNGSSTLNLSRLGVSGVIPETGVLVRTNPFPVALTVILGAAIVLAAAGGYYAFRRGPSSRSGATTPDDPNHAPTAFGKRRKRDGD